MRKKRTSGLLPDQSETSSFSIQDGDNDNVGIGWILGWYSGCVNILYMSIHEKQNGAFMFSSCLPLRSRLSFWCWWIKAQTGNRIQRKDTQGLPYIVEQLSTPLIHLIRFSQLSFFFFSPSVNIGDSNLRRRVLRDTRSQVHPHQYQQKEGKKIKPPQNTYCWSALI